MDRNDVRELNYITPIQNLPSILERGILSHKLASKVAHSSVAMDEIQDRRKVKVVPGGRPLHEYVNLYFDSRNPMLYKRRVQHLELCVLQIDPAIMELSGVVIADRNASSGYARFASYPGGLSLIDRDMVYAESWIHADQISEWKHKAMKCAEVLVPDLVKVQYILGARVSCRDSRDACVAVADVLTYTIDEHLFFR
ncbi:MAG: hypothetical protein A4E63_03186 [Syntrophorhabdus sp. PtaU1.Bin050]|nr:MAG: hypothetical protein A4E63_03186 [Syntrophorhabdus sp. PtaU1.Bin050]